MLTITAEWVSYLETLLINMVRNSGKSTIDLTLTHGIKNIKVETKDFTLIKTKHKAIEILIEQEPLFKPNSKFRTKNGDWEKWKQFLQAPLEDYSTNFPRRNFRKSNRSTGQQIDRAI